MDQERFFVLLNAVEEFTPEQSPIKQPVREPQQIEVPSMDSSLSHPSGNMSLNPTIHRNYNTYQQNEVINEHFEPYVTPTAIDEPQLFANMNYTKSGFSYPRMRTVLDDTALLYRNHDFHNVYNEYQEPPLKRFKPVFFGEREQINRSSTYKQYQRHYPERSKMQAPHDQTFIPIRKDSPFYPSRKLQFANSVLELENETDFHNMSYNSGQFMAPKAIYSSLPQDMLNEHGLSFPLYHSPNAVPAHNAQFIDHSSRIYQDRLLRKRWNLQTEKHCMYANTTPPIADIIDLQNPFFDIRKGRTKKSGIQQHAEYIRQFAYQPNEVKTPKSLKEGRMRSC